MFSLLRLWSGEVAYLLERGFWHWHYVVSNSKPPTCVCRRKAFAVENIFNTSCSADSIMFQAHLLIPRILNNFNICKVNSFFKIFNVTLTSFHLFYCHLLYRMMATGFPKTISNLLLKYKIITFDIKLAVTIITNR